MKGRGFRPHLELGLLGILIGIEHNYVYMRIQVVKKTLIAYQLGRKHCQLLFWELKPLFPLLPCCLPKTQQYKREAQTGALLVGLARWALQGYPPF